MPSLDALYQDIILDHNRRPRNFRVIEGADRAISAQNPLCGDEVTVWVKLEGDRVSDVSFRGTGCAISRASASLMTGSILGKSRDEALNVISLFHRLVTGTLSADEVDQLGQLKAFAGVARFPQRVKCASMAWHALRSALGGESPMEIAADGRRSGWGRRATDHDTHPGDGEAR